MVETIAVLVVVPGRLYDSSTVNSHWGDTLPGLDWNVIAASVSLVKLPIVLLHEMLLTKALVVKVLTWTWIFFWTLMDFLEPLSWLPGDLQVIVFLKDFRLESLGIVVQQSNEYDSIGLEPCNVEVDGRTIANLLCQLSDIIHDLIILVLDI